MRVSFRRIWGILLRQTYVLYHSPPSVINIIAWPVMNILIWGFMNSYLAMTYGGTGYLAGNLLASAILWEIYVRSSWGLTGCIDEEFTSRNLGSMMATAASLGDYIIGFILNSLLKTGIALVIVALVIWTAFDYSVISMGSNLFIYVPVVAMFGCSIGFMMATLLFRWGKRAEPLCWFTPVMLAFVMCPYYPLHVLPQWLQSFASMLPATWIFEALRDDMAGKGLPMRHIQFAYGLGLIWFIASLTIFSLSVEGARKRGRLLNTGD